jgi:ergothioneine biosynthesis protein EgtB
MAVARTDQAGPSAACPERYLEVRALTEELAAPLSAEDQTAQSMPDVSPTKWHRAHVTWFFEEFLLGPHRAGYQPFHPGYRYLFNSYYEAVGPRHPRPQRGVVTRPGIEEITAYRRAVDHAMAPWLADGVGQALEPLVELGLHHEQQHQELLLMDIKHVLSHNVLDPVYRPCAPADRQAPALRWIDRPGGLHQIGADRTEAHAGFSFDNEGPRHRVVLEPHQLASRAVTAGEVAAFVAEGGYQRPELWLSDGWATVQAQGWEAPLYWRPEGGGAWSLFTLGGRRDLDPHEPAVHLSYYEADAIARWFGARLPTEPEWEVAAAEADPSAACFDLAALHPRPAVDLGGDRPAQLFGDVWEWTSSAYLPYPGFHPAAGAVGEYNGKFMVNQQVLRGGCCATPPGHLRATYRNFFPAHARWAFSGVRLARDLEA